MKDINDLDPDVQELVEKQQKLRDKNGKILAALERVGVGFDTAHARMDHLMSAFVDAGIMSDEQFWAILLQWEEGLNKQLEDARSTVQDRLIAAAQEERKTRIIKPGGSGKLIVPGQ